MSRWFKRWMTQVFLADYARADATLADICTHIKTARCQLYTLYEEVELAIRALDVLGERVEAAKQRVQQRIGTTPDKEPMVFTDAQRQRGEAPRV